MEYNEKDIIEKCKLGDNDAFEILIKNYDKKVYNMIYRIIGNKEDAFDLTQEVFIKVYKSIRNFRGDSSFSTWLYRLATNTCFDENRRKQNKKTYSLDKPIETELGQLKRDFPDDINTPDEILIKKEMQNLVQKAISMLPEEQRVMIVLRDIQGFSYKEISETLQCSMGTVKSRINRGRLALKNILESLGEPFFKSYV